MKRFVISIAAAAMMIMVTGCGPKTGTTMPKENVTPAQLDPESMALEYLYTKAIEFSGKGEIAAVGIAWQSDLARARSNAATNGRDEISRTLETKMRSFDKTLTSEMSNEEAAQSITSYKKIITSFAEQSMNGARLDEFRMIKKKDHLGRDGYQFMQLIVLDRQAMNSYLQNALAADKILKLKFEEKKLKEELQSDLEKEAEYWNQKKQELSN